MPLYGFQLAEGSSDLLDLLPGLNEYYFERVIKLVVDVTCDEGTVVTYTYELEGDFSNKTVDVSFYIVGHLEFPYLTAGGEFYLPSWEIYASDRGLERVNFLVRDVEEEFREFACSRVTIEAAR